MLFREYDTMIANAYIVFKGMPQSHNAIALKGFRLQCAWGLILPVTGHISSSQALQSIKPKSTPSNVKEDALYPWAEAVTVSTFQFILRGGSDWALLLEREEEPDRGL